MKRKLTFYTLLPAVLILSGCSGKNNQISENSSVMGSATPSVSTEQTMISEEEARQIALNHSGLAADQVTYTKSSLDRDDSRQYYDVEFYTSDQKEYEYEIDPFSGAILEWDVDSIYGDTP